MGNPIVIGVDTSDEATAVAARAARLAERPDLRPVLAHVEDPRKRTPGRRRGTEVLARACGADPSRWSCSASRPTGAARRRSGRGRDSGRLARPPEVGANGSVSLALATRSEVPVLVVPPSATSPARAAEGSSRTVVCGVGDSEDSDRAVQAAADVARAAGLPLVLVHAQREPVSLAMMPTAGVCARIDHRAARPVLIQPPTARLVLRPVAGDGDVA
jgi:Universal stress protein family